MKLLRLLSLLFLTCSSAAATEGITCVDTLPKPNNCYKLYQPKGSPRGLVVLLPGFGDTVEFYDQFDFPKIMQSRGYLVAAFSMAGYIDWEKDIKTLHTIISEIVKRQRIPRDSLAIGGFSAGGTGAIRYAEYCVEKPCSDTTRAAATFSVDGPLDFERWYRCSFRKAERQPADPSEGMISKMLSNVLGGSPSEKRATYVRAAPLMVTEPNGGNARLLKGIAVRAYAEPDIAWTIENWSSDYYCLNAVDQAALVMELKFLGNKNAELIITSGKGYRAEFITSTGKYRKGERSPHSWMIVDELNLADWIERYTRRAAFKPESAFTQMNIDQRSSKRPSSAGCLRNLYKPDGAYDRGRLLDVPIRRARV